MPGQGSQVVGMGKDLADAFPEVRWTFDPLESRNAHLNLNHLGAGIAEYVEEMYAGEMGSELARGIGTYRFIVSWRIAGDRVADLVQLNAEVVDTALYLAKAHGRNRAYGVRLLQALRALPAPARRTASPS